ncbi:MAG: 50S ribosomal protein L16 [Parcubacteria group bacterium GW2011_GWA2_38_13]|nr:MAG: 50S ribosomal protein L16 [Parcubacteria group bacterium GW2011_GWA2_38_13]
MLIPKKIKHRKWHKGTRRGLGVATSKLNVSFGKFGIKSEGYAWVTSRQIEAARRAVAHYIKRGGKVWIRIFPDKPVTMKGTQSTMGSGKGGVDHYVAVVKPGMVLYEMDGIPENMAREALRLASFKLPVKTKFVTKY